MMKTTEKLMMRKRVKTMQLMKKEEGEEEREAAEEEEEERKMLAGESHPGKKKRHGNGPVGTTCLAQAQETNPRKRTKMRTRRIGLTWKVLA